MNDHHRAASTSTADRPTSFEQQARTVLLKVRAAVLDVLTAVGGNAARPQSVSRQLKVDRNLAWKMSKIAQQLEPFAIVQYLPGSSGIKIFVKACRRAGAPDKVLDQLQAAMDELQQLIEVHAGNRATFQMMLASEDDAQRKRVDLDHRKGAFQHNGYLWGVQAKAQIHTHVFHPSEDGETFDVASVRGFVDLCRLRPRVPWRISRMYTLDDERGMQSDFVRRASLDEGGSPEDDPRDLPLLTRYCSRPLPQIRRSVGPRGRVEYQLVGGAIGNTNSLTCMTGEVVYGAGSRWRGPDNRDLAVRARLRTPCELLVLDVLIHGSLTEAASPACHVFSDLFTGELDAAHDPEDELPVLDAVRYLGRGREVAGVLEIPWYAELIGTAFDRLGWNDGGFDVYRFQMAYPPIPSAVVFKQAIPERGDVAR